MAQHHAGAGADRDRHARDDREGGKQAAPDAPFREAKTLEPRFSDAEPRRHCLPQPQDESSAAVSRYPVNKSGKPAGAGGTFIQQKQKGRRNAGLSVLLGSISRSVADVSTWRLSTWR